MANNKVHVITGGGGGMGLATARRLSATGTLLLADRSADALAAAKATLGAEGIAAETAVCDVTDGDSVAALAALVAGRALGALVHIAGIDTAEDPRQVMQVNLGGTMVILDHFEPLLSAGSVGICIASMGGHMAPPADLELEKGEAAVEALSELVAASGDYAYILSKKAVIVLVEQRARRWAAKGARLLSLSPGVIETNMGLAALNNPVVQGLVGMSALARSGQADEIAGVIEFLVSDRASFMTGTDILVDGGAIAGVRHPPVA